MEFKPFVTQLQDIQILLKRCFNIKASIYEIAYKYQDAIGFIAYEDTRPVASYVVFRQWGSYAQSGDTMTDPDYRKRGLFITLAAMTYKRAFDRGVAHIFGFPNENSYPGFVKLGWKFKGRLQNFVIETNNFPFVELMGKMKIAHTRHGSYNGINYKVKNHLYIGHVAPFHNTGEFIKSVREIARRYQCRKIIISVSENNWLYHKMIPYIQPVPGLPIGYYPEPFDHAWTLEDVDTYRQKY